MRKRTRSPVSDTPAVADYLSTGEVARLFGVSPSTATRWARTGAIPTIRTPGGHYRFRARDVRRAARWIADELVRLD